MNIIRRKKIATVAIFFVVIIAVFVGIEVITTFNDTEYVITVTGKDRIVESTKDNDGNKETTSKYIVFADDEDGESLVFENTDCFIRLKFNSSNIQGQLKENHTYKITVIGYRIPFFSMYQNIIRVEDVE
ncbi:MAG: DUF1523 family protein [Roseburia sp.]|nr:DUF1523 family protein [Roseburia sp.]